MVPFLTIEEEIALYFKSCTNVDIMVCYGGWVVDRYGGRVVDWYRGGRVVQRWYGGIWVVACHRGRVVQW